jgi:ubiquinone/menaquinone biosynthesis C-methylase UbiE
MTESIPRQLEPEVMDTVEDARDYNAMDHTAINQLFATDFLAAGFAGRDILDVGTGTALIPIEVCRQRSDCRILAIDLAVAMLDLARVNVETAGFIGRIQLAQVDAKKLPYPDRMFDAVMSNSILHHLPHAESCLGEAVRVTRSGGLIFFRDLLRPNSEQSLRELVAVYAAKDAPHARQLFADSLRAAFTLDEVRDMVGRLGFDKATVQKTSDRHWTFRTIRE